MDYVVDYVVDCVVDYATALNDLLKEQPELRAEAQRIFLEGATTLEDPEHPRSQDSTPKPKNCHIPMTHSR